MARQTPSLVHFLFSFDGRISRSAFWLKWILPFYLAVFGYGFAIYAAGPGRDGYVTSEPSTLVTLLSALLMLFMLVSVWPALAVYAKRWHDRDKSGWWTLILFVPLIGGFWFLIECGFLKGTTGPNRFGADPVPAAGYQPAMSAQA